MVIIDSQEKEYRWTPSVRCHAQPWSWIEFMEVDMSHSRRVAPPVFVKYKLGFLRRKVNQNRVLRQLLTKKNTAEAVFFPTRGGFIRNR